MSCLDDDAISAYASHRMADAERATAEEHLSSCELCLTLACAAARNDDERPGPRRIDRYEVRELLGEGAMGSVYAAYDPQLARRVAVKLVRSDRADHAQLHARLADEARALAQVRHPNVVAVHDAGEHDEGVFIAMELVDGETLRRWCVRAPRTWRDTVRAYVDAGRGLAAAHAAGIVHRDFKPDNVLVERGGRVLVGDFGIAAAIGEAASAAGTPQYMAPEQSKHGAVSPEVDQYSFAAALWETLYGELPGERATVAGGGPDVVAAPSRPRNTPVPSAIARALQRALATDPAARFPGLPPLLDILERALRPRRIWPYVAGLAAVAALATGAVLALHHESPAIHCGDGAARVAGTWNPGQRDAVAHAFAATETPFAPAETATVTRALDAYASALAASYDDSCRATYERGEQSAELLDRRAACLSSRRAELAGVVGLFVHADAATVARAHGTVGAMTPVAGCDDLTDVESEPEPTDPMRAAMLANVRDEIGALGGLRDEEHASRAITRAEVALAEARATSYQPAIARALGLLGALRWHGGDVAGAKREFEACDRIARTGDFVVETVCAAYLAQVAAREHDFENAHGWAQRAATAAANATPPLRAFVAVTEGQIAVAQGQWEAALALYEQASAIEEQAAFGGYEHGQTVLAIATANDELGRYAEARKAVERARALVESDVGPWHPAVAAVLVTVGNIDVDEGDDAAAADAYKRALAIRERGGDRAALAQVLNDLGVLAVQDHQLDDALAYLRRGLAIREADDPRSADVSMVLTNIAHVEVIRSDCTAALADLDRSLAIAETLGASHPYVGDALLEIGRCRLARHELGEAQTALDRALAIRSAGGRPVEMAEVQFALARTLWDRGVHARAVSLASSARSAYATTAAAKDELAEVDAWIAAHHE